MTSPCKKTDCKGVTKVIPYWFILNRGYISSTQDILNNIVIAGNYLYPSTFCPLSSPSPPAGITSAAESTKIATGRVSWPGPLGGIFGGGGSYTVYSNTERTIPDGVNCIAKLGARDIQTEVFVPKFDSADSIERWIDYYKNVILAGDKRNPLTSGLLQNVQLVDASKHVWPPVFDIFARLLNIPNPEQTLVSSASKLNLRRKTYKSADPMIASPNKDPGDSYQTSTYYLTYNTDKTHGGVWSFNPCDPSGPCKIMSSDSGVVGPDDWLKPTPDNPSGFAPARYHLINNNFDIRTRNNADQILIMDPSNNIFMDDFTLMLTVNVIFYCGYASKWLSTVEPFRSLLLGYPIDFIENQLNIFSQGVSDSTIDAIRIPLKPVVRSTTIATPSATGIYSAASVSVPQTSPVLVTIAQAEAAFPSRSPYSRASPNITLKEESVMDSTNKKVVTKMAVTNSAPGSYINPNNLTKAVLCVPTYWIIRQLWDMCSQADAQGNSKYPVMGFVNGKLNIIENIMPDFANNLVTDYLKITYRCYFWALNFNNKSFDDYANNAANNSDTKSLLMRTIINELRIGLVNYVSDKNVFNVNTSNTVDYSYYVDAAAYYKALYDNNFKDKTDYFLKPSSTACEPKCGTIGVNKVSTPDNPDVDIGRRYPPCAPGCGNGIFCLNKSPNTVRKSFLFNGRDSVDPTGFVFCNISSGGESKGTDFINFVRVPPIPDPPPPPPPSVSATPLPRLSTADQPNGTNPTVRIREGQTFLCEDRSLRNVYKYTLASLNGPDQPKVPAKLPYQSLGMAASYTPDMDIASSTWVWKNSLDGIILKCRDLPIDNTTPSITCPLGQNCDPPPSKSPFHNVFPPTKTGPDDGPNGYDEEEEEPKSDGSLFASMGSLFICGCIAFTCISGIMVLVIVMMGKSAPAAAAAAAPAAAAPAAK